jgi:ribonuclease HII
MAGGPTYSREAALQALGVSNIVGCDEAGLGAVAGPVNAVAVILDPLRIPKGLNDSKKLSAARREDLFSQIVETASVAVVQASVARIDRDNILQASLWALAKAVEALAVIPGKVLVDGRNLISVSCPCEALIGGDGLSASIAAASIVAKVTRDRLMVQLAEDYPGYGFERHMGYGTADHLGALKRLGPTPHHRRTFAPVAALFGTLDEPLLPGLDAPFQPRSLEISA